jgi:kynurenine formamidase
LIATFLCGLAVSSRIHAPSDNGSLAEIINLNEDRKPSLYGVYDKTFKSARYIDLTHAFSPYTAVWPGFSKATFKPSVSGADMEGFAKKGETFSYEKHGFVATAYELTTDQYGTQLDPPAHWNEYGATISDLPATFTLRPLVVINIAPKVKKDLSYAAGVEDVKEWEESHGRVPEGSVVFFRSDWSLKWQEYKTPPATYPGVQLKTLKFLHLDRKILFHGHEPLDTDMTATLEGEAWLMHNNFAQAEGVTNLQDVPEFGCLLSIGFAKPLGGAGGYARYVAICPEDSTEGGTTIADSPGAPLPRQSHPLRRNDDGVLRPDPDAEDTKYCSVAGALGCRHQEAVWVEKTE